MIFTLIGVSVLLSIVAYLRSQRKPKNFPPGPWGFPILGHLPLLGLEPNKTAAAWKQKYGPIVGIDFASFPTVIISDHTLARQAFAHPAVSSRPNVKIADRLGSGKVDGLLFSNGRTSREQREFVGRHLRQLRSMQEVIMEQLNFLLADLRTHAEEGRPVPMHGTMNIPIFNTMWALIAGHPFEPGDPIIRRFTIECIDAFASVDMFSMLAMFMPWFANNFPTWLTRADQIDSIFRNAGEMIEPYIDEHYATHVPGEPRDFIDSFIDETQRTDPKETGSSFHSGGGKHSLMTTLLDLFTAGIETTGTSMSWVCLLLAANPKVQQKVADEIQAVIGSGQTFSLSDRPKLPYTEAMIHEVLRYRTLVPIGAFRSTSESFQLAGYTIPKDTMMYINIWEAHNNREIWGDPENFRPERWLSPDGSQVVERGRLLSFGTGKRVCIGEQLARDELFLFTVGILQEFRISTDPGAPFPDLEPRLGGSTLGPKPHKLLFSLRHK